MLPKNNLPTMMGLSDDIDAVIASSLNDSLSLVEALAQLSKHFIITMIFDKEITLRQGKRSNTHTFKCLFISSIGNFCYGYRKNSRRGFPINDEAKHITELKFKSYKEDIAFKSYEQFYNKFDTRFITEKAIKDLWNGTSAQHGGKYNKNDFRKIGKIGKEVLSMFLGHFKSLDTHTEYYRESNDYDIPVWVLRREHHTRHHTGRDISISHQTNIDYIFYSSERQGCLNGRYGLLISENEYLWLEDD